MVRTFWSPLITATKPLSNSRLSKKWRPMSPRSAGVHAYVGRVLAFTVTFLTPVLLVRVFSQAEFGNVQAIHPGRVHPVPDRSPGCRVLFILCSSNPQGSSRYAAEFVLMLGISGLCVHRPSLVLPTSRSGCATRHWRATFDHGFFVLFMLMEGARNHDDRPQALSDWRR